MGLRYVRGLREEAARSLLLERIRRPFISIHDLARRVPELRKDELTTLAEIGALNSIGYSPQRRRDTKTPESQSHKISERSDPYSLPGKVQHSYSSVSEPALSEAEGCLGGEKGSRLKPETRNLKLET